MSEPLFTTKAEVLGWCDPDHTSLRITLGSRKVVVFLEYLPDEGLWSGGVNGVERFSVCNGAGAFDRFLLLLQEQIPTLSTK